MKNTKIIIKTTSKSYPVYFGNGIINLTGPLIKKNLPEVKKMISDHGKDLITGAVREVQQEIRDSLTKKTEAIFFICPQLIISIHRSTKKLKQAYLLFKIGFFFCILTS